VQGLIVYAVFVGILFTIQRSLLYYPHGGYQTPANLDLAHVQELHLPTADGQKALSWFAPPPEDASRNVIIYFHGNGNTLSRLAPLFEKFRSAGFGYLAPEYRGYPGYKGKTTEQGIYQS
jgi:fermentation-respiration switch protein FrsA (DUF1100 family)